MNPSPNHPLVKVEGPTQLQMKFLELVAQINEVDPKDSGSLSFLSRVTVQANLPLRNPHTDTFERRNGYYSLTLQAPPRIGLPYGRYPRLLLAFLGREAVRTRSRQIHLGDSFSAFMREVGVRPSGGSTGPMRRFRDQTRRLLNTTISFSWEGVDEQGNHATGDLGQRLASKSFIWWAQPDAAKPKPTADGGYLVLTEEFYEELRKHPVPVDSRVLAALVSPLAIDIYMWLTYRYSTLSKPLSITWENLATQFGTQTNSRIRNFRQEFRRQLKKVRLVYPNARVEANTDALLLYPSPTHVRPVAVPALPGAQK